MKKLILISVAGLLTSALASADMPAFKFDCTATSLATGDSVDAHETVWLTGGLGKPSTTLIVANYQAKIDFDMDLTKAKSNNLTISLENPTKGSTVLAKVFSSLHLDGFDQIELMYNADDKSDSIVVKCSIMPSTEPPPSK